MGKYSTAYAAAMAAAHTFPEGWDTREKVAVDLGCSVDRVAELMAPMVRSGAVERKEFRVWDAENSRIVRATGYRITQRPKKS